jgi:heme ABC exporter ATP-binding subunit CcmA
MTAEPSARDGADQSDAADRVEGLIAEQLGYHRAGRDILDQVSLRVAPGELLAVTGPSGSGKSSLLAILAGLERPDRGWVRFAGERIDASTGALPEGFGLVLQGYGLVSLLTAAENVGIVLQTRGIVGGELSERVEQALEQVGLTSAGDQLIEELSGGQQQRVAIARALVVRPRVLLADELTAELDAESRGRVMRLVSELASGGAAVVLATHDPDTAARCDRQIRLVGGRVN